MQYPSISISLVCFALCSTAPAQNVDVLERLALADGSFVDLSVPDEDRAGAVTIDVPFEGATQRFSLQRDSVRGADYRLRVQGADGRITTLAAPPSATFIGTVAGRPASVVAASLFRGGLTAAVIEPDGSSWFVEPVSASGDGQHIVYRDIDLLRDDDFCGTDFLPEGEPPTFGPGTEGAPACLKLAEIAFDVDFQHYQALGLDVAAVVVDVEAHLNAVNAFYARDVLIRHEITDIIVRTAEPDPYTTFDPYDLLDDFRAEWLGPQVGVPRDLAHLITGRDLNGGIIGLAWVGSICNQNLQYGWTQFTFNFGTESGVLGHEMGHNWSAPHCLDAECNVMCGLCHEFGPNTTQLILNTSQNASCLAGTGPWPTPLPPHALAEEFVVAGAAQLDVLANDLDGNCDALVLESFPANTQQGGTLALSSGTGANGADELSYTPATGFQGADSFTYVVGDGTGLMDTQAVDIFIQDELADLVLHYRLDEPSGTIAIDSSPNGIDGTYLSTPALGLAGAAAGTGSAVGFNGSNEAVRVPNGAALRGLRWALTVAAWIRPDDLQGVQRVFGNPEGWEFGLAGGNLRFTTLGMLDYDVPAGLSSGVWTHVAVTFDEASAATFYVNGSPVGSALAGAPANTPAGDWFVASHALNNEFFDGRIDDLQVYDHALTAGQIAQLFADPGTVSIDCAPPAAYCTLSPNSVGPGAAMSSAGSTCIAENDLALIVTGCPAGVSGIFFYSESMDAAPFGDGTLCLGGPFVRMAVASTNAFGNAVHLLDVTAPPIPMGQIEAGDAWYFSFWYRDVAGGPVGFNLANGLATSWCP